MAELVVEISKPPYGHENTFAGLYVALGSLTKGHEVTVVLRGDGVYSGRKGQEMPLKNINLPPTEQQIQDIVDLDGRVVADRTALEMRGISKEELIDGIEVVDTEEVHDILLEFGDHVVAF
jgi:sulfur relay (sulfurtransferase) DsrF/TusC family protein